MKMLAPIELPIAIKYSCLKVIALHSSLSSFEGGLAVIASWALDCEGEYAVCIAVVMVVSTLDAG